MPLLPVTPPNNRTTTDIVERELTKKVTPPSNATKLGWETDDDDDGFQQLFTTGYAVLVLL